MGNPVRSATFPIVGPRGVAFNAVHVERLATLDRNERFAIAPGFPDLIDILMDARATGPAQHRLDGVTIVFGGGSFSGKSYGLALAIADQRARRLDAPETPVIATGVLVPRGRGLVAAVEGFEAKSEAVLVQAAQMDTPPVFAFPSENWKAAPPTLRTRLEQAERAGALRLLPCATLADAAQLWHVSDKTRNRGRIWAGAVALAVLLLAGIGLWRYLYARPVRACETIIRAISADDPRPDQLADAARTCSEAASRFPAHGRIHFLLGQVRALDGNDRLAAEAWKRSADLGDVNGMVAHGRRLLHPGPNGPARATEALQWLNRAAAAGSAAAAADIGYWMIDAGKPAQAREWLLKARKLRDAQGNQ